MRLGYLRQTQHKSDNSYSFQTSPVLTSRALLTLTFKMRFLLFKTQPISQAKSKQACMLLEDQKNTGEMFYLFPVKVKYLAHQLHHLHAVVKVIGWLDRWIVPTCHLLTCSRSPPLVAQARGEKQANLPKGCSFQRHLVYFTAQTTVLRGLGH